MNLKIKIKHEKRVYSITNNTCELKLNRIRINRVLTERGKQSKIFIILYVHAYYLCATRLFQDRFEL